MQEGSTRLARFVHLVNGAMVLALTLGELNAIGAALLDGRRGALLAALGPVTELALTVWFLIAAVPRLYALPGFPVRVEKDELERLVAKIAGERAEQRWREWALLALLAGCSAYMVRLGGDLAGAGWFMGVALVLRFAFSRLEERIDGRG